MPAKGGEDTTKPEHRRHAWLSCDRRVDGWVGEAGGEGQIDILRSVRLWIPGKINHAISRILLIVMD